MDPLASYKAELAKEKAAGQKTVPGVNLLTDQPGGVKPAPAPQPAPAPAPTPAPAPAAQPTPPPQNVVTPPPMPKRRGKMVLVSIIFLLLAAGGAGGAYWYIQNQGVKPAENTEQPAAITASSPYEISDLKQKAGESEIGVGEATNKKQVTLEFTIPAWNESLELVPQVEVRPVTENFTGEATSSIAAIQTSTEPQTVTITAEVPADGAYHWQARVVNPDKAGEWLAFSKTAEPTADFVVDSAAPAAPTLTALGTVQYAAGVKITEAKPGFTGKAEPGSLIMIELQPSGQKLTTTADAQGNWSVLTSEELAAAPYTASLTAGDKAGNTAPAQSLSFSVGTAAAPVAQEPAAPVTPATGEEDEEEEPVAAEERDTELADTGDNSLPISLLGFTLLALGWTGLRTVRRHDTSR